MIVSSGFFNLLHLVRKKILHTDISLKVVLYKECLSFIIHPFKCVSREPIHMSVSIWNTTLTIEEHNVLDWFRSITNEVPWHIRISDICLWVSISTVDNIRELNRISNEEERSVIADPVTDSIFCVKFNCESSWISVCVRETFLS